MHTTRLESPFSKPRWFQFFWGCLVCIPITGSAKLRFLICSSVTFIWGMWWKTNDRDPKRNSFTLGDYTQNKCMIRGNFWNTPINAYSGPDSKFISWAMHQAGAMTQIQSKNSRQLHHSLRLSWNQTNISINAERYTACQIWNPARCIQKRCKYLLRLWHTRLTYAHRGVFTVTHPVYAARILVSAYFGAGAATPARPTAPLNWSENLPAYMINSIWRKKKKKKS